MKNLKLVSVLFILTVLLAGCGQVAEEKSVQGEGGELSEVFEFESVEHDFGVIKQSGGVVSYDFPFTYNGEEVIKVTSVPASCACTSGEVDKEEYKPGENGVLTVYFNPNLHAEPKGRFYKTVSLVTEPALEEMPEVKIWQEIDLDLGEEFFELSVDGNSGDDGLHASTIVHDGSVTGVRDGEVKEFSVEVKELQSEVDDGQEYLYWTYDGTVPGPFMRVKEGDTVRINFSNHESSLHPHTIDLHAVNGPGGGAAVSEVYPGESKAFEFKALNPGVYVYHCATPEVAEHMANGMYGLIVVEPEEGYPEVDKEFYVMQGEIYSILERGEPGHTQLSGIKLEEEDPEYIVFNGRKNSLTGDNALEAEVGDRVRIFIGNGGVAKVSNFHVIGEIFDDVYPEGGTPVQHDIQTTVVPAGGASIVEFTVDVPGVYKLVDHALARLPKGALAELVVTGPENPEIFKSLN